MALVTINKKKFLKCIGKKFSDQDIEEVIGSVGMSFEGQENGNILVDVTANRPDMLGLYGLSRAVSSFTGKHTGLKKYKIKKANYTVEVINAPAEWPYAVTAVVKGLCLDDEEIKEIIQLQEKIGATLFRNRKKGGMGVYPLEKIKFPVKYTGDFPERIKFRPLEFDEVLNAVEILENHPTGIEYARGSRNSTVCRSGTRPPPRGRSITAGRAARNSSKRLVSGTHRGGS